MRLWRDGWSCRDTGGRLIASLVLFALVALLPGDEIRGMFGFGPVDEARMAEIREALNLDRPVLVQWWLFLVDFVTWTSARRCAVHPSGASSARAYR